MGQKAFGLVHVRLIPIIIVGISLSFDGLSTPDGETASYDRARLLNQERRFLVNVNELGLFSRLLIDLRREGRLLIATEQTVKK